MNPATFNFLISLFEDIENDVNFSVSTRVILDRTMSEVIDKYHELIGK